MPGYDKNRFITASDDDLDEFCCGICLEILDNPLVTNCCRQTYCCDCINQWLSNSNTCSNDRKQLSGDDLSPPPRAFINLMNKMQIRCDYYSKGCQSVVLLSELAKHSTDCDFNPKRKCKNCETIWTSDHNCIEFLKSKVKTLTKVNENNNQMISENEAKLKDVVEKKDYEYFKLNMKLQELELNMDNKVKILTTDYRAKTDTITQLRNEVTILNRKLNKNNVQDKTEDALIKSARSNINKYSVNKTSRIPTTLMNKLVELIKQGLLTRNTFNDIAEYISDKLCNDRNNWTVIVHAQDEVCGHSHFGIKYIFNKFYIELDIAELSFLIFDN